MTSRAPVAVVLAALATSTALVAAPASAAGARTWYTNPQGTNTPSGTPANDCTKVDPCFMNVAFTEAQTGDTILLGGGGYGSQAHPLASGILMANTGVVVRDVNPANVPVLWSSAGAGLVLQPDSSLSGLKVNYTGSKAGLVLGTGSVATQVAVVGNTPGLSCVVSGTLADSVCINTAAGAIGAAGFSGPNVTINAAFRGDTIEGTGTGQDGILYSLGTSGTASVDIVNSIVHGAGTDIRADSDDATTTVNILAEHSDYITSKSTASGGSAEVSSGAGNTSAKPKFTNPSKGDYTEAAGSPTINAGTKDPATETDLLRLPRTIGGAPDMGAFERKIPPVLSRPTITAGKKTAKIKLTCNPEGLPGATILFKATILNPPKGFKGKKTLVTKPQALSAVAKAVPISITLGGLTPKTKYSVVVVARNPVGKTTSKPIKITTT